MAQSISPETLEIIEYESSSSFPLFSYMIGTEFWELGYDSKISGSYEYNRDSREYWARAYMYYLIILEASGL